MAHNPDEDTSTFQKTVVLRDWWLIKCSNEFEGKRFGVAGTEIAETGAVRMFKSAPIIKAFDLFTLEASDGICIILQGFLNKERVVQSGFLPEISKDFLFGFPSYWEQMCNNCFKGVPSVTGINTVPSVIDKASRTILSPCKNMKGNLEDSPVERRDKSSVNEKNTGEINDKDGRSGGSIARDRKTPRRKSLRLQSKSIEVIEVQNATSDGNHKSGGLNEAYEGNERKLDESEVKNRTNDGDYGSDGLDKAKSGDVEKDECETFSYEGNERKLDESEVKNRTNDGDHGSEGLDKAKNGDVEKDECETFGYEGNESKFKNLTNDGDYGSESLDKAKSSDVEKGECETFGYEDNERKLNESKVKNRTNDGDLGSEGLDKAKSSDVEKDECEIINKDGSGKKHTDADNVDKVTSTSATGESRTSEQRNGEVEVTGAHPHSMFEDLKISGNTGKKAISKESGRTLRSDGSVVEPVNHPEANVKTARNKTQLDVSEVQDHTTNDVDHSSEDLNKAEGNDVEKDECMAIHNEEISPVDGCGNSATKESLTSEQRNDKQKVTKTSLHSLPKAASNSSKPGRKGKSKKSEKILSGYWGEVEPRTHSGSKVKEVEENLSGVKINRKINFDEEVTPEKDAKKQKTNPVSADSSGQRRSRSGRLLVSSLEYWRSQIPVYDRNRNLIKVTERHETNSTPSKGKGSGSRKPRR